MFFNYEHLKNHPHNLNKVIFFNFKLAFSRLNKPKFKLNLMKSQTLIYIFWQDKKKKLKQNSLHQIKLINTNNSWFHHRKMFLDLKEFKFIHQSLSWNTSYTIPFIPVSGINWTRENKIPKLIRGKKEARKINYQKWIRKKKFLNWIRKKMKRSSINFLLSLLLIELLVDFLIVRT
jgi:hypothetical protein